MGPSNDFRQQRLPFGLGRAATLMPDDYQDKTDRWAEQRQREDQRARCIDDTCAPYRRAGRDVQLHKPETDPRLHLVVDKIVLGVFVERNGVTEFCSVK